MEDSTEELFTTQLRKATRKIHSISDTLVQSKFVLGLIDDRVWAEGLLVFYEVFYFLENAIQRQPDSTVGKFNHPSLKRVLRFEADLELYYGADWKITQQPKDRECVRNYLNHLEKIERSEPVLLVAYIYHLYLGLLSGGQILRKKQKLIRASKFSQESSVVDFEPGINLELKTFIKSTTNEISDTLDENTKKRILDESVTVFKLNCELIRSVSSTREALFKMGRSLLFLVIFVMLVFIFYKFAPFSFEDDREKDL